MSLGEACFGNSAHSLISEGLGSPCRCPGPLGDLTRRRRVEATRWPCDLGHSLASGSSSGNGGDGLHLSGWWEDPVATR